MTTRLNPFPLARQDFAKDPFGYSALGSYKWASACLYAGYPIDESTSMSEQLKNPILWMAQAHAMTEAAQAILLKDQEFELMPFPVRGVCESQYCAVGLMLVGYSLEICLKAMIIVKEGVEGYTKIEKTSRHHRLHDLASLMSGLSKKDNAILRALTHFVSWAGRYPDPGSGREDYLEEIFGLGEKHQITAADLFKLSSRVMQHTQKVVDEALG